MIYYLPLEHLNMRYTAHLDKSIVTYLKAIKKPYCRIYPTIQETSDEIIYGSFLDAPQTIEFKAKQIAEIARLYAVDKIKDGDIIFVSDIWFPGLESIAYLNYFCKKNIKMRGILHAGSFTDTDFVRNLERWAKYFEDILFDIIDRIYVGSEFMKQDVIKKRLVDPNKIEVTGLPLDFDNLNYHRTNIKENIIIFNGRNVDEKQPWLFDDLKNYFSNKNWIFINTQKEKYSKREYYKLLGKAKVIISFALQENFGFGILEAVYLGCIPILPKRLVYPEFFVDQYLYKTFDECIIKVECAMNDQIFCPGIRDFSDSVETWFI